MNGTITGLPAAAGQVGGPSDLPADLPLTRPTVLLTDLEGTTSSLRFVQQVLFPYARAHLADFVARHAQLAEVQAALAATAPSTRPVQELLDWIDQDRKHGALKALQGCIWESGYARGELLGHFWPDAVNGMRRLAGQGIRLGVYSSGSVRAQQLLFRHSVAGDVSQLISHWFDTAVGPKQSPASYQQIEAALGVAAAQVLFLSDVPAELDAARTAGFQTCCIERGEQGYPPAHAHPVRTSFDQLVFAG